MFQPTLVQTAGELRQIHELNKSNLRTVLSEQAKQETGFLTWLYSEDLLTQLHQLAPSVIVKDGDRVAGYALVTLRESGAFHPDLQTRLEHIET
ncbi:MAG TPA: hypothetical protein VHK69_09775 [Chitinophagaceae bacterium]|nr:hypothetical protein [Chitinophagaceae bacterium]